MKLYLIVILLISSCSFSENKKSAAKVVRADISTSQNYVRETIVTRFNPATGFERKDEANNSFAYYLRSLPLYPAGKKVKLYNGKLKGNQNAQAAVIKMDVGDQDLQQCADAVMRLRAEYLYKEKRFADLHFNFTNGFKGSFDKWQKGYCFKVKGNNVSWVPNVKCNDSYLSFRNYMNWIFMYAGTASLEKEMKPKSLKDIEIGDVFIKGGFPGHAVIVVDLARNREGDKVFLLAQSYMPAQEIHVLKNPNNTDLSPWYKLSEINEVLETPEWDFKIAQLMEFSK